MSALQAVGVLGALVGTGLVLYILVQVDQMTSRPPVPARIRRVRQPRPTQHQQKAA
jgi:hypothetical protein